MNCIIDYWLTFVYLSKTNEGEKQGFLEFHQAIEKTLKAFNFDSKNSEYSERSDMEEKKLSCLNYFPSTLYAINRRNPKF